MRRKRADAAPVRQPRFDADEQSFVFRRSRTITGSAATSVRAGAEERGQLRSPRLHEHGLRKHRRRLSIYLTGCVLAAGGLFYVISSYIANPTSLVTRTAQPLSLPLQTERYSAIAQKYLDEHPLERFDFSLNDALFSQYVRQQAPELSNASIESGSLLSPPVFSVAVRQPVVAWKIQNTTYFVDADGVAFERNYFPTPNVVVADKSGIDAEVGVIASEKLLRYIGRMITLINQTPSFRVESVTLPAGSTRQVDVKLTGRAYAFRTNLDRDPAGQAADVVNAAAYIDRTQLKPAYVDVRVPSKAFYRPS